MKKRRKLKLMIVSESISFLSVFHNRIESELFSSRTPIHKTFTYVYLQKVKNDSSRKP